MATKQRHDEPQPSSSRTALIVMALGAIAVAGLLVWALTRTVETTETAPPVTPVASTETSGGFTQTLPPVTATQTTMPPLTATQTSTIATATAAPPAFPVTTDTTSSESPSSVPRISVEDLREKSRTGSVTIVDVRDAAAFASGHIPGAIHIPFARIEGEMGSLPKNKPIVTYCT